MLVYLSIGSNLGDSKRIIDQSISQIDQNIGTLQKRSSLYKTQAWGKENQDDFLNACIIIDTELDCESVLKLCQLIEKNIGRKKTEHWGPRQIDIDIIFYENECIDNKALNIPHPLMHKRRFVLEPLNEIASDKLHPIMNKSVASLLKDLKDSKTTQIL